MENVDFSEAELRGVAFLNGIDLGKCKFPTGENYLLLTNPTRSYQIAAKVIKSTWVGEDQRLGLALIGLYTRNESRDKPLDFLDFTTVSFNGKEPELGRKFFKMLRKAMAAESGQRSYGVA